jgi:hypothetical protein
MNDQTKTCLTWIACTAIVALLAYGLMESYTRRVVAAMENGYEQASLPGQATTAWVRADGDAGWAYGGGAR